jgi:uncharacterized protein YjiS (DUF1127 family)
MPENRSIPMSTANLTRAVSPAIGTSTVVRLLTRAWLALGDRRSRRAAVAILASLDQRTLHDIGVDRHEIESIVHGGGRGRRRNYDADWRKTRRRGATLRPW